MPFIYSLHHPDTDELRYVGKANNPVSRLRSHVNSAPRYKTHVSNWICSLKCCPAMKVLAYANDSEIDDLERYWIRHHKEVGTRLCNHTEGGDGWRGKHSDETKQKQRDRWKDPEYRAHITNGLKGHVVSDETRAKIGVKARGKKLTPDHIEKRELARWKTRFDERVWALTGGPASGPS